jgi:DNA-binding transcriptional LysR family regulator
MDIYQLRTFVAVARERSITRASELLHLSQPAVSAHIKALEDGLGIALFERTPRGMSLTREGERLLVKAEQTLAAHQDLVDEASRIKGRVAGTLRIGAGSNSNSDAIGTLLTGLAERYPEVEVILEHGSSVDIRAAIRNGSLDAGLYNDADEPEPELATISVSEFTIFLVAPPGTVACADPLDWKALAEQPWVYPATSACCGRTAEKLFKQHHIRPKRTLSVDREEVTRTLIAGGVGVGLLHAETARRAERSGEIVLLFEAPTRVRVQFGHLASRAQDPLLIAATSLMRADPAGAARSR